MNKKLLLLIFAIALQALNINAPYAADELSLRGVVKNIDVKMAIITVMVTSQSCLGVRSFSVDNVSEWNEKLSLGKTITFSSECKDSDEVYKMNNVKIEKEGGL